MCPISDMENIRLIVIVYSILLFGISSISLAPLSWFVSMLSCGASLFGFGTQWLGKRWHRAAHGSSRCFTKVQRTGRWWRWITKISEGDPEKWNDVELCWRGEVCTPTLFVVPIAAWAAARPPLPPRVPPPLPWRLYDAAAALGETWCDVLSSKIRGVMPLLWGKFRFYADRDDIIPVITMLHGQEYDVILEVSGNWFAISYG